MRDPRSLPLSHSSFAGNSVVLGAWLAVAAVIVASSLAIQARLSTTLLVLMIGSGPFVVMVVLGKSAAGPTVAEILHSVESEDGTR